LAGPENHFEIYQKNGPNFIPERYHYADNRRITPLLLVCDLVSFYYHFEIFFSNFNIYLSFLDIFILNNT